MPEFVIDESEAITFPSGEVLGFTQLAAFTQGYIEAMLFTENSPGYSMVEWEEPETQEALREGTMDGDIPEDAGFGDIHPETFAAMQADCMAFENKAHDLLMQAYGYTFPARTVGDGSLPDSHRPAWDYDARAAGRDFWYTRNGHGVGFWDRGLGEVGDALSEIARKFGDVYVSFEPAADSPTGYGYVWAS